MHILTKDTNHLDGKRALQQGLIKYFIQIYSLVIFSFFVTVGFAYFVVTQAITNSAIIQSLFIGYNLWVILLTPLFLIIIMTIFLRYLSVFPLIFIFFVLALSIGLLGSIYFLMNPLKLHLILYIPWCIFVLSSAFTFAIKYDFTGMKSFIISGIVGVTLASFIYRVSLFMDFHFAAYFELIIFLGQCFLLTCFIIWKTQNLKKNYLFYMEHKLEKKAVIMGALDLFLAPINLFFYLPRLIGGKKNTKLKI